jgi:hypothetical protein
MQTTITHTCGHTETVQMYGTSSERDSKAAWLAGKPCQECQRKAQQAQATESAQAQGLPALTGSDKQVAWATTIRAELLGKVATMRKEFESTGRKQNATEDVMAAQMGQFDALVAKLTAQTAAAWWIDRRTNSAQALLKDVSK